MEVRFYNEISDAPIKYAVIASRYKDKWVFCKHKERSTYEIPGGHREEGETVTAAAIRELTEETGAKEFNIFPVCVYSVQKENEPESFGMLYYAEITELEDELHFEIESVHLFEKLPSEWTYPLIQPKLIEKTIEKRGLRV